MSPWRFLSDFGAQDYKFKAKETEGQSCKIQPGQSPGVLFKEHRHQNHVPMCLCPHYTAKAS